MQGARPGRHRRFWQCGPIGICLEDAQGFHLQSSSARTSKTALRRELKRSQTERAVLPRSLLLALFGRSLDPSSGSKSANGPRLARRRPVIVKRCPWCGKILQRRRTQPSSAGEPTSSDPPRRDSAVQVRRTNADQLPFVLPLMPTSTFNPPLDAGPVNTTPSSSRRPHPYAMLGSLRSINTHVCRRKSKSSSEWNRIKFMVRCCRPCAGSFCRCC